jgi:Spy/CpxP family protein refolding chaperone
MKKFRMFVTAVSLTIVSLSTTAQTQQTAPSAEERATKQTENMAVELNLTPEQKEQIYAINLGVIQKNDAIRANTEMSSELKRQSVVGNNNARRDMIMSVLTPEQKPKYEEMEKGQKLRMKQVNNQIVKPEINE